MTQPYKAVFSSMCSVSLLWACTDCKINSRPCHGFVTTEVQGAAFVTLPTIPLFRIKSFSLVDWYIVICYNI